MLHCKVLMAMMLMREERNAKRNHVQVWTEMEEGIGCCSNKERSHCCEGANLSRRGCRLAGVGLVRALWLDGTMICGCCLSSPSLRRQTLTCNRDNWHCLEPSCFTIMLCSRQMN